MNFFPTRHFIWREPKAFPNHYDAFKNAKLRWWHRPLWVLLVAALLMANWFIASFIPDRQRPSFLLALSVALAGGAFFIYVIPWMITFCPSEVHFYDSYLVRV